MDNKSAGRRVRARKYDIRGASIAIGQRIGTKGSRGVGDVFVEGKRRSAGWASSRWVLMVDRRSAPHRDLLSVPVFSQR